MQDQLVKASVHKENPYIICKVRPVSGDQCFLPCGGIQGAIKRREEEEEHKDDNIRKKSGAFSCARGWQNNRGNCYAFFEDLKTWYEAEAECKRYSHGAHLASILTKAESDFMSEYTSNYRRNGNNIWIGLHTFHQDRKWRWADGAAYTYNTWMPREPNNQGGNEDCVELWRSSDFSKWNDAPCTKRNAYICMYEL
ncbi:regenerating islet-derived protein 4-like [Hemicordylus capensis]|uniref:regenerating islet-derived protein 4-like n=1 Tax=Hemicordylus capensis TaxID=884348 RepID=UPI00230231F3|nr:regenerating islet-derived protein 4-like [Hemicordylus capensis]